MAEEAGATWMGRIELAPPDPILGIAVAYKADTFEQKVDLGIGAYRTEEGNPYMFNAVRQAEQAVLANEARNKEYQTIGGNAEFTTLAK
jgi:aspartate aminotransferase